MRVNGNLVDDNNDGLKDKVTLRWNPVEDATGYNVRYVEEVCKTANVVTTLDICSPEEKPAQEPGGEPAVKWLVQMDVATGGGVIEVALGGLAPKRLYRVEVQAFVTHTSGPRASDWSDFTLVFPTDGPLAPDTDVATARFHGHQAGNAQGRHVFRYRV